MPFKDFRKLGAENEDAKNLYYQEYLEEGSFRKEVLEAKTADTDKDYEILLNWYQNKFNTVSEELAGAKSESEELQCQNKMIAYFQIFKENTLDIFKEDLARKGKELTFFSSPQTFLPINRETVSKFRLFDTGLSSFSEQVDRTAIIKKVEEQKKLAAQQKEDAVKKAVSDEKRDYRLDIHEKYQELQTKYNEAFTAEVEITSGDWNSAYRKSDNLYSESKNVSITEMVVNYERDVIGKEQENLLGLQDENVKAPRQEMEDMMFNLGARVNGEKFRAGMEKYDRVLKDASVQTHAMAKNMTYAKMTLYAATKKRMDERGFFSKLFHPSRTKKENAMFAKMREDVKNALGADNAYMDQVDHSITKNNRHFQGLPETTGKQELSRVDYSPMIREQAEKFGQKRLAEELNKAFNMQKEKTAPKKNEPVQQKQLENNNPKVE